MRRSLPVVHFDFSRLWAGVRPITLPHHLAILLGRHAIGQKLLAGRTAIDILGGIVDEVLLAETTIRLRADVIGFGNVTATPSIIASLDLRAVRSNRDRQQPRACPESRRKFKP